jgi:cyclin C
MELDGGNRNDVVDPDVTGSHEEFWTFSQVSQWGSHWPYSNNDRLNYVRTIVITTRSIGLKNRYQPRMVHFAQMLLWRFYLKENDVNSSPPKEIIPLAYESAAQLLETRSFRDQVAGQIPGPETAGKQNEFKLHFNLVVTLDFNIRIHHPSEYITEFVTSQFDSKHLALAECIIADSFLCPCCLVHQPRRIAEGAVIMAAGMLNSPGVVRPKCVKAISFIRDMKCFYQQSLHGHIKPGSR